MEDEVPEEAEFYDNSKLLFTFLIDRSGSMYGSRIRKAREALILFMRSLPQGCLFSIISFGTDHSYLEIDGQSAIRYTDRSSQ